MLYLWLKALHVGAVLVFLGGLAAMALAVATLLKAGGTASSDKPEQAWFVEAVHRWDHRVTSPALGLVWILGPLLVWMGGWLSAPWFLIKLFFVVLLSALHGMLSGMLRRAVKGKGKARPIPRFVRHFPAMIVVSAVAVAVLAVVKPFA